MLIRLQKYLADCGIASRRKAEQLILEGCVSVNGEIITTLGFKVDDELDDVCFNGKSLNSKHTQLKDSYVYIMLNKPEGYVTTTKDQFDRKSVLDLIKEKEYRLYPVGRLDYDTSGLLLLTNDGNLTYKLTHPKHNIEKVYIARIKGIPTQKEQSDFSNGVYIDGRKTAPSKIRLLNTGADTSTVKITIKEGRNRQVRKMLEAIGHNVISLKRIATGELSLGKLETGQYRYLSNSEIDYLKNL